MKKEKTQRREPGEPRLILTPLLGVMVAAVIMFGTRYAYAMGQDPLPEEKAKGTADSKLPDLEVPPPPFSEGIFPCSECHAGQETNPQRRVLEAHEDIILKHDEENRWCLDCHDAKNRDLLHLADGAPVEFKESYRLCGQCHGLKLKDWKNGVHGKRTGYWNGQKEYLLCVHCHNPHSPRFKKLKPDPPPVKPGGTR